MGVLSPETLRLVAANPNPSGAAETQLFILTGDATGMFIENIELAPGLELPNSDALFDQQEFFLRILHFNDLHGHLMHFTQFGEQSVLSRLAGHIQSSRRVCQAQPDNAVLVITAGDDCGGSIFDEMMVDGQQNPAIHPGYHLYSKMGVDVAGLGNHDLDRGSLSLADAIRNFARFPVLAANIRGCTDLVDVNFPAAILVVKGIRIGLIGLVTRAETHLDRNRGQIVDPIPVAQNLVTALRPLCDVLIIVSHLGTQLAGSTVPMADAGDVELACSLPFGSVDLIVGGHSHSALNRVGLENGNFVNGIPIVQSGACGEFLGQVDMVIRGKSVKVMDVRLIPVASLPIDQDFEEMEVKPFITRARELRKLSLGNVEYNPNFSTAVVFRDFARCELALANFITDALVERLTQKGFPVDCAMIDASVLHCGLPFSETLTYGDCFELMPHTDTIRLYQLTGRQLWDLLNDNALRIDRPSESHTERGFLQFSREVEYAIRLGNARSEAQVTKITIHGIPIKELTEKSFFVASTCFVRELACSWETEWKRTQESPLLNLNQFLYTDCEIFLRQEIVAYIQKHNGVSRDTGAKCDGRLKFDT